jgi:hypothetical protein
MGFNSVFKGLKAVNLECLCTETVEFELVTQNSHLLKDSIFNVTKPNRSFLNLTSYMHSVTR